MANREQQVRDAEHRASHHRRQAGELFAEHRSAGDEDALSRAKQEMAKADAWQQRASQLQGSKQQSRTEAEEAELGSSSDRRAWFKEGSVADDKLQQFQEAAEGQSLMGQLVNYAARSTLDRQHRTFDGAKMAGRAAMAPARSAARTGQAVLNAVRQHKSKDAAQKSQELTQKKTERQAPERSQAPRRGQGQER